MSDVSQDQSEPKPEVPKDEVLTFRLQRKERQVTIEDENGDPKLYVLREMMGNGRDQWLNTMAKRMKVDKTGQPVGVGEFIGLQASLISRCLYDCATSTLVPETRIAGWPATVQKALFAVCQDLNGLVDSPKEEQAKNS